MDTLVHFSYNNISVIDETKNNKSVTQLNRWREKSQFPKISLYYWPRSKNVWFQKI